jgi:hypothetical protein
LTLVSLLALSVLVPLVNYGVDPYGLFRSARSKKLYDNERSGKYLLSERYVPEHYDGLLLGSSTVGNWPTSRIGGYRIFNGALSGGNMTEEKLIADHVLDAAKLRIVMVSLTGYLLQDHGRKRNYMCEDDYWSALGSPQLLAVYAAEAAVHLNLMRDIYAEDGSLLYPPQFKSEAEVAAAIADFAGKNRTEGVTPMPIDPIAVDELRSVVTKIRANGAMMVTVFPPVPEAIRASETKELDAFEAKMRELGFIGEHVIDLNAPAYKSLREDPANFIDVAHLSVRGTDRVMDEVSRAMGEIRSPVAERR